ncbi:hypothetical protein [Zavarzinia compransoris]|uniref:Uncharacterized protein n=1 Tax=Zavarzinia compransoris TaxID=1264899 RepID=A0A317E2T5_9PROT|nr:hypothetical protein [Zavarzinia compransoris]PWR20931.1 hypothetical protein DKG75_13150 [Zavarzinia compransoris]TDP43959.1 hypothetical protein DES42_1085 [Zavarzinia compransoris]
MRLPQIWASVASGAILMAAPWVAAQGATEADTHAVAETSFQLDAFGGGDEGGGLWGGAPSVALPLGGNLGLQVDGIAGRAADSIDFYGGAVQLFYRDPQRFLLGAAAAGLVVDGESQFSLSAIGEYYLDTVTLEAMAGFQSGDIVDGGAFARLGFSYYGGENFRFGGGISYSDETKLAADVEMEYRIAPENGIALFASGAFDKDGDLGLAGVRVYFNDLKGQTESGLPSLKEIHRHLGRRNLFLAAPTVTGARFIGLAAGALSGGDGFGEIQPPPAPAAAPAGGLGGAGGDPLSLLTDLLNGLVPTTDTGTPLDGVPVLGDVLGAVVNLLSPDTVRVGDLPTAPGSIANLPLLGDVISLLPAQGIPALLGSLQPEFVASQLVPALLQGLTNPEVVGGLLGNLGTGTLGNLLGGLLGDVPLPAPLGSLATL